MAQSPADLIKEIGVATIAHAVKQRAPTVRMWRHRNSIPRTVWPELLEAFPDRLSVEKLKAIEAAGE